VAVVDMGAPRCDTTLTCVDVVWSTVIALMIVDIWEAIREHP
jgi:hypothetical protein